VACHKGQDDMKLISIWKLGSLFIFGPFVDPFSTMGIYLQHEFWNHFISSTGWFFFLSNLMTFVHVFDHHVDSNWSRWWVLAETRWHGQEHHAI
jgi:hypothetical protein